MTDHDTGGTLDGWDDELTDWQAEADRLTAERRRQQTATRCESGTCIIATRDGDHIHFTALPNRHGPLRGYATLAETRQFFAEVKAGKWDNVVAGDD